MSNHIARALAATVVSVGLAGAAYAGTAIAHADNSQDVQFINLLDSNGINANRDGVAWGQGVCWDLDNHYNAGWSARNAFAYAIDSVYDNTASDFSWNDSINFVSAAVVVYCPRHDVSN